MPNIQKINFHGNDLVVIPKGDKLYVAMKPVAEAIGLDWHGQRKRIQRNEVLNSAAVMMTSPSNGGTQEVIALPADYLNGWLFSIDANRVKPEIKEKLIQYQRECYKVLFEHFQPKVSDRQFKKLQKSDKHKNELIHQLSTERTGLIEEAKLLQHEIKTLKDVVKEFAAMVAPKKNVSDPVKQKQVTRMDVARKVNRLSTLQEIPQMEIYTAMYRALKENGFDPYEAAFNAGNGSVLYACERNGQLANCLEILESMEMVEA